MTRHTPQLTTELLNRALALPATAEAPRDLHASIAAAFAEHHSGRLP